MVTAMLQCIGACVREVHPLDVSGIMAIEKAAFAIPMRQSGLVFMVRDYHHKTLVLERGGKLMAYCIAEENKNSFQIRRIASASSLCGFGKMLVSAVQRRAMQERKGRVDVLLDERDVGAQMFFSKVGFRWVETVRVNDGDKYLFRHSRGQR